MWLARLPLRGGYWHNGVTAGVFARSLNNARSYAGTGVGFRPALGESQKLGPYGVPSSTPSKGPAILGQVPKNMNRPGRDSTRQRAVTPRPGRVREVA